MSTGHTAATAHEDVQARRSDPGPGLRGVASQPAGENSDACHGRHGFLLPNGGPLDGAGATWAVSAQGVRADAARLQNWRQACWEDSSGLRLRFATQRFR
jgi:hypothetical protein